MNGPSQTVEAGHEEQVVDIALTTLDDRLKSVLKRFSQATPHGATNPERIHQLRVATRRASAAIDFYEDFITRKSANKMARCLKRIRGTAGKVRDCDLLLARFSGEEAQAEAASFIKRVQASRASAFRDFRRLHRRHDDSNRLKRRARKILAKTRRKAERRPHLAVQKFKDWAPERLRVFVSEFFQAANPDLHDFTQLHQFRIRSKALRYAMELVASTFPPSFSAELYPAIERLQSLLAEWKFRPPCRFDFVSDHESFPHFSYQYVLYGMGFRTDFSAARARYGASQAASRAFEQLRQIAQQAARDLPTHRSLIEQVYREGFQERAEPTRR